MAASTDAAKNENDIDKYFNMFAMLRSAWKMLPSDERRAFYPRHLCTAIAEAAANYARALLLAKQSECSGTELDAETGTCIMTITIDSGQMPGFEEILRKTAFTIIFDVSKVIITCDECENLPQYHPVELGMPLEKFLPAIGARPTEEWTQRTLVKSASKLG